jgi:4-hydroxymandelate oxidase
MARGAAAAGTIHCQSSLSWVRPAELAAGVPEAARWVQLYWSHDREFTRDLAAEAVESGCTALVLTVDVPLAGRRERDLRTAFQLPADLPMPNVSPRVERPTAGIALGQIVDLTLTWRDLEWLAGVSTLPLVIKGILAAGDALLACEHGAAAVSVSNHGGRQLDSVPAALESLPEVVDAVAGRAEVLMDGGIRRGTDVLVTLALGAKAVLAGRACYWGLAVNGADGVSGARPRETGSPAASRLGALHGRDLHNVDDSDAEAAPKLAEKRSGRLSAAAALTPLRPPRALPPSAPRAGRSPSRPPAAHRG